MFKKVEGSNNKLTPIWEFELNNTLTGVYVDKKTNIGANNSIIYEIDTPEGCYGIWGNTLLDDKFQKIKIGERVQIVYQGKQKTKDGKRTYRSYEVSVDRDNPPITVEHVIDEVNAELAGQELPE